MNMPHRSTVVTAAIVLSATLVNVAWKSSQDRGPSVFEVRDDKGRVRCRLGLIDGCGYGLQVIGEEVADQLTVTVNNGEFAFRGTVAKAEGHVAIVGGSSGAELTMGDPADSCVRVALTQAGDLVISHSTANAKDRLLLRSETAESGRASIELRHPSVDAGKASGLAWIADAKGATFDLLQGGKSAVQLASMNEGMTYLLLGARRLGIYLQATASGSMLLEMCDGNPRVVLQSTKVGSGLGIERENGSAAVRVGLSRSEEIRTVLLDQDGKPLPWVSK